MTLPLIAGLGLGMIAKVAAPIAQNAIGGMMKGKADCGPLGGKMGDQLGGKLGGGLLGQVIQAKANLIGNVVQGVAGGFAGLKCGHQGAQPGASAFQSCLARAQEEVKKVC